MSSTKVDINQKIKSCDQICIQSLCLYLLHIFWQLRWADFMLSKWQEGKEKCDSLQQRVPQVASHLCRDSQMLEPININYATQISAALHLVLYELVGNIILYMQLVQSKFVIFSFYRTKCSVVLIWVAYFILNPWSEL